MVLPAPVRTQTLRIDVTDVTGPPARDARRLLDAVAVSEVAIPGLPVEVRVGRPTSHELPGGAGIENPVSLAVSDNGPGIPEGLRARLFEPFVTGRVGGTGLGLAIVQRAVEAHRGLVLVDTSPGKGTTFTVYLPAARRKEEAA